MNSRKREIVNRILVTSLAVLMALGFAAFVQNKNSAGSESDDKSGTNTASAIVGESESSAADYMKQSVKDAVNTAGASDGAADADLSEAPLNKASKTSEQASAADKAKKTSQEKESSQIIEPLAKSDMTEYNPDNKFDYISQAICTYDTTSKNLSYAFDFPGKVPISDDDKVYLFEIASYENEATLADKTPLAKADKAKKMSFAIPYADRYLFERFVPAIKLDGEYVPLGLGQYITNPEVMAINTSAYPEIESKKGLLLDGNTVGSDMLFDLNVKRLVYNMPLSIIMGETNDAEFPTIEYEYNGETYLFNGHTVMVYDSLYTYLTLNGFHCTAIVLNDWNHDYRQMMHPKSRHRTGKSMYYAFNTEEEEGARMLEAVAMFLAERYSSGEHGMVYDWVIANEANQQTIWNYMETADLDYYTESFEKSFRTFYNAIRSVYGNANVYYSIDHDWNDNYGDNSRFFNGRDFVYRFNEIASEHGNYNWGLSIHPYPQPLTRTKFWKGTIDKSEKSPVVTPMNLSTLTDVMVKDELRDTNGDVRDIAITELGFSSRSGEEAQAAAFAYCYYIIDNNEYISSFLMNRQTDDRDSLKSGLALGIYNNDYSKKQIYDVFVNIDTPAKLKYLNDMLDVIGANSLKEALEWAQ